MFLGGGLRPPDPPYIKGIWGRRPQEFFSGATVNLRKKFLLKGGYKRGFNKRHKFFKNLSFSKLILKKGGVVI